MGFDYNWMLATTNFTKDKGKVFSCFAGGGGSTMGYKLAGFDVLGCCEIDKKMIEVYRANHNPKYSYLEPIQTFKQKKDLPDELYNLDILDGSPPCSSFSMAGNREKDWGKEKKFREGQAKQILDNLFFDFIELADKLQPKVVIAENVKGLLLGDAIDYVRRIYKAFDKVGYYCQHWLLDASRMGVPQKRERVFFICLRKDLAEPFLYQKDLFTIAPLLNLYFRDQEISFEKATKVFWDNDKDKFSIEKHAIGVEYKKLAEGEKSDKYFQLIRINRTKVCPTILGSSQELSTASITYPIYCRKLNNKEICLVGSFPLDYNFNGNKAGYIIGMSVPPVMTARIATEVYSQWLCKL